MEQPIFDARHHQCKQSKVEIQARDMLVISLRAQALCITCYVKRLIQHWDFMMREYS